MRKLAVIIIPFIRPTILTYPIQQYLQCLLCKNTFLPRAMPIHPYTGHNVTNQIAFANMNVR